MPITFKIFIIFAGIWNICDGIISVKAQYLGHTTLSDFCRMIRAALGLGLVLVGLLI